MVITALTKRIIGSWSYVLYNKKAMYVNKGNLLDTCVFES